jgi:hypothetical protein
MMMERYGTSIVDAIKSELRMIKLNEGDRYLDGYVASKYKKELLDIYWYLEDLIEDCNTYIGEDEWYKQREKDKMIRKLSKPNGHK